MTPPTHAKWCTYSNFKAYTTLGETTKVHDPTHPQLSGVPKITRVYEEKRACNVTHY